MHGGLRLTKSGGRVTPNGESALWASVNQGYQYLCGHHFVLFLSQGIFRVSELLLEL